MALLTTGCHHKQVSHNRSPSPPYRPSARPDSTATVRRTPAYATPDPNADDNAVASGRVNSTEVGLASWYGPPYHNHQAANGEIFDQNAMTAAHRTLPLGTVVSVTNLATGQAVTVRINDRGPFIHGRVLDLSLAAAKTAGVYRMGVARVRIDVLEQNDTAVVSNGRWCVQVGAFLDKGDAVQLQGELQRRYSASAKVIEFAGPTGHWVRINPAGDSRAQALQIAHSIRPVQPGALAFLVRLD